MSSKTLSHKNFLATLPDIVLAELPATLLTIQVRRPWRWLVQFHFGEPRLHYEVSRAPRQRGWEIGFHCEARDKQLNRYLLDGFRRHLFEIKETVGEQVEAEMWDRGWTKIYEVCPEATLTPAYQQEVGRRTAALITCVHPIFVELRRSVTQLYR